jgi:hypothetical protein
MMSKQFILVELNFDIAETDRQSPNSFSLKALGRSNIGDVDLPFDSADVLRDTVRESPAEETVHYS